MASIEDCQEWHTNASSTPKQTKLTEPVQVGLWYETNGGCITCINHDVGDYSYPMHANNGQCYDREGKSKWYNNFYDLVECLGVNPFVKMKTVSGHVKIDPKTGEAVTRKTDMDCLLDDFDMPAQGTVSVFKPEYPTLHDLAALHALQGLLANVIVKQVISATPHGLELLVGECRAYADEFMRHKNEREQTK